jgi:hypothetical protein
VAKLRFAIMCPELKLPFWQALCIRELVALGLAEPVLLIVDMNRNASFVGLREDWRRRHQLLFRLYNRFLVRPFVSAFRPIDMAAELGHLPRICCGVEQRKFSQYFGDQDLDLIRAWDLDFVLRFAFGIIRGPVLSVARYGIWSFHHGDERVFRGSPAGFWELFHDRPTTGVILQRLSEDLDNGTVLFRGRFRTALTYLANLDRIYLEAVSWPALCVKRIARADTGFVFARPEPSSAPIRKSPSNREFATFVLRQTRRIAKRAARALLFADDWNIGVVRAADLLRRQTTATVRWARPDRGRFLADPMPVVTGERILVFAERLDYLGPAKIVSLSWPEGFAGDQATVELAPGCHVSYPFVFHHGGRTLMVPETRRAGRVSLWSRDGGGRWQEVKTLLRNAALVDPTLVRHGDRWWLFCCEQSGAPDTRLVIYFASEPTGAWQPHPLNPVKVDVCSARPAGPLFEMDGILYRPAEDGAVSYGGAITINRIDRLSPEAFSETPVARIEPAPDSPYPDGVHTLAMVDGWAFVDGKRTRFRPDLLTMQLRSLLDRRRRAGAAAPSDGPLSTPTADTALMGRASP